MLVLITGNAGFIGTNFVKKYLKNTDTVVGYDKLTYAGNTENMSEYKNNKNFVFIEGSINNKKYLKEIFSEYDFDAVKITCQEEEVSEVRIVTGKELRSLIEKGLFIENEHVIGCFEYLSFNEGTVKKHSKAAGRT